MTDNYSFRTDILAALDKWTKLDPATREDTFIEVDLIDGTVNFIDADELMKFNLAEDQSQRLSFYTINPWDFAEYDVDTEKFSFPEAEVEEAISNALSLRAEFAE